MKYNSPCASEPKPLAHLVTALIAVCLLLCASSSKAQSSISGLYPNGMDEYVSAVLHIILYRQFSGGRHQRDGEVDL